MSVTPFRHEVRVTLVGGCGAIVAVVLFAFGFDEDGIPAFGNAAGLCGGQGWACPVDGILKVIEPMIGVRVGVAINHALIISNFPDKVTDLGPPRFDSGLTESGAAGQALGTLPDKCRPWIRDSSNTSLI